MALIAATAAIVVIRDVADVAGSQSVESADRRDVPSGLDKADLESAARSSQDDLTERRVVGGAVEVGAEWRGTLRMADTRAPLAGVAYAVRDALVSGRTDSDGRWHVALTSPSSSDSVRLAFEVSALCTLEYVLDMPTSEDSELDLVAPLGTLSASTRGVPGWDRWRGSFYPLTAGADHGADEIDVGEHTDSLDHAVPTCLAHLRFFETDELGPTDRTEHLVPAGSRWRVQFHSERHRFEPQRVAVAAPHVVTATRGDAIPGFVLRLPVRLAANVAETGVSWLTFDEGLAPAISAEIRDGAAFLSVRADARASRRTTLLVRLFDGHTARVEIDLPTVLAAGEYRLSLADLHVPLRFECDTEVIGLFVEDRQGHVRTLISSNSFVSVVWMQVLEIVGSSAPGHWWASMQQPAEIMRRVAVTRDGRVGEIDASGAVRFDAGAELRKPAAELWALPRETRQIQAVLQATLRHRAETGPWLTTTPAAVVLGSDGVVTVPTHPLLVMKVRAIATTRQGRVALPDVVIR